MAKASTKPSNSIAFQGFLGANSHIAINECFPKMTPLPCAQFEDAFIAVQSGKAKLAMIPVESHVHALGQCRKFIRKNKLKPFVSADTAGAAKDVAERGDKTVAAIAPKLASQIYGLKILAANIEDADHNTTRFLIMSKTPRKTSAKTGGPYVTSFVFRLRSVPAALYKALGGFATNGVNMTKLESYMIDGKFSAAQFYADVDGHPNDVGLRHALEDLRFYSQEVVILGTYPASPFRAKAK
jgi:prephenate dehydratase